MTKAKRVDEAVRSEREFLQKIALIEEGPGCLVSKSALLATSKHGKILRYHQKQRTRQNNMAIMLVDLVIIDSSHNKKKGWVACNRP